VTPLPLNPNSPRRPLHDDLLDALARLERRAESAPALFAVPLGPASDGLLLPRFVVFGGQTDDHDARISILAGFDRGDVAASLAVIDYLNTSAGDPAAVGGVVLDAVPIINRDEDDLWHASWLDAGRPELRLLEREYRRLPPHAVIKVRTEESRDQPGAEIFDTDVRLWLGGSDSRLRTLEWMQLKHHAVLGEGVAGFAEDLPFRPLELNLVLPAGEPVLGPALLHDVVQRLREIFSHAQYL
jgi:hypothetical protein